MKKKTENRESSGEDISELEINYEQLKADCEKEVEEALSINIDPEDDSVNFTMQCEKDIIDLLNESEKSLRCKKHNKAIEAYCVDDFSILCISCILEDGYQSRNIISIKKAIENQHDNLQDSMRKAQKIEQSLISTKAKIENHLKDVNSTQQALTNSINSIYDSIIEKITKRKEQLIQDVKEIQNSEHLRCNSKLNEINEQISNINELKIVTYEECKQNYATVIANSVINCNDVNEEQSFRSISSLANAEEYNKLMSKCLEDNSSFDTQTSFKPIYKKNEIDKILEIIDPNYKKRTTTTHSENPTERNKEVREKQSFKKKSDNEGRDSFKNPSRPPSNKPKIQRKNTEEINNIPKANQKPPKIDQQSKNSLQVDKVKSPVIHKYQKPNLAKQKLNISNAKMLDYNNEKETNKEPKVIIPKETKVFEVKDRESDDSFCETIKFKESDVLDASCIYSVADSTVIVSASNATPKISTLNKETEQRPLNIHSPSNQLMGRFQTSLLSIESPVKIPKLNLSGNLFNDRKMSMNK